MGCDRRGGRTRPDELQDVAADAGKVDPDGTEGLHADVLALGDETEQQMLRAEVVVVEHPRFLLHEDDDPPGFVGEPFEDHAVFPPQPSRMWTSTSA
jgi:hypothetical protein